MLRLSQALVVVACAACVVSCGGDGGGAPAPSALYAAGPLTVGLPVFGNSLEVGYVDGDARPDVVLAGTMVNLGLGRSWGVEAAFGAPDGSFEGAAPLSGVIGGEMESPLGIRTGYFDLDAELDVVAFADLAGQVGALVCLGDGTGAFDPVAALPTPLGHEIVEVAVVDANEDFLDDLAFATDQARVGFLLANGLGGFVAGGLVAFPVAVPIRGLTVTDVNRDGHADILALQSSAVEIALGDGLGGATLTSALPIAGGANPQGLVADSVGRGSWLAIPGVIPVPHVTFYHHDGVGGFDPNTQTRVDLRPGYDMIGDMTFALGPEFETPRLAVLAFNAGESRARLFVVRTEDLTVPADEIAPAMLYPVQVAAVDLNGDLLDDLVLSGFDVDDSVSPPAQRVLLQSLFATR